MMPFRFGPALCTCAMLWFVSACPVFAQANPASASPAVMTPALRAWTARVRKHHALVNQARRLLRTGKPKNALPLLRAALATDNGGDFSAPHYLADAYAALGNRPLALYWFRRIVDPRRSNRDPLRTNPHIRMRLVLLLLKNGSDAEAREAQTLYLQTVRGPAPQSLILVNPDLWPLFSASSASVEGETFSRSVLAARAHGVFSATRFGVGDIEGGLRESEIAVTKAPNDGLLRFVHGFALRKFERRGEARAEWTIAARTGTGAVKAAALQSLRQL